jgi:predicted RNA-binding protein YlxR (DUF448 family)
MNGKRAIPQRTCVICRCQGDKRDLTRIVRSPGGIQVDPGGKMSGRGAYLCERDDCWQRAISGSALSKALRTELSDDDRERLLQARPKPVRS